MEWVGDLLRTYMKDHPTRDIMGDIARSTSIAKRSLRKIVFEQQKIVSLSVGDKILLSLGEMPPYPKKAWHELTYGKWQRRAAIQTNKTRAARAREAAQQS